MAQVGFDSASGGGCLAKLNLIIDTLSRLALTPALSHRNGRGS